MIRRPEFKLASEHAVRVGGGGRSLSVLATPKDRRNAATYELSDEARRTLNAVLAEDAGAPRPAGA